MIPEDRKARERAARLAVEVMKAVAPSIELRHAPDEETARRNAERLGIYARILSDTFHRFLTGSEAT